MTCNTFDNAWNEAKSSVLGRKQNLPLALEENECLLASVITSRSSLQHCRQQVECRWEVSRYLSTFFSVNFVAIDRVGLGSDRVCSHNMHSG